MVTDVYCDPVQSLLVMELLQIWGVLGVFGDGGGWRRSSPKRRRCTMARGFLLFLFSLRPSVQISIVKLKSNLLSVLGHLEASGPEYFIGAQQLVDESGWTDYEHTVCF